MTAPRMVARVSDFDESVSPVLFRSVDSCSCFTIKHTLSKLVALTGSVHDPSLDPKGYCSPHLLDLVRPRLLRKWESKQGWCRRPPLS